MAALLITLPLWRGDGVIKVNRDDPVFFQWMLVHAARIFTDGDNPFLAEQMNAPFGVNLMANTSMLALAIPLTPVTLLFGPYASFLIVTTAGLAGTAFAWYYVLSRHLVRQRVAALIGGAFCGFAPGMIAHANGHPNIISQFLVPFIVLAVLRLPDAERWRRNGLTLAGLVIIQVFVNEEVLFLTALSLIAFVLLYLVQRLGEAPRIVTTSWKAVALCAVTAGVTLAFPLYWQFFGPANYIGLPPGVNWFCTDLYAAHSVASESLTGSSTSAQGLASSPSEENTFFGTPLLFVLLGVVLVLVRSAAARSLMVTVVLIWGLSLGPHISIKGQDSGISGPWEPLTDLPIFSSVVPTRLGVQLIPMIGLLLALAMDRFRPSRLRPAFVLIVVAALLPIVPTQISISDPQLPATPRFFTSGTWRSHLPDDAVVLPLPPGRTGYLSAMQWQIDTNLEFTIVGGYYLAPLPGDPTRRAAFGPAYPPTMRLFWYVGEGGGEVYLSAEHRRLAQEDLSAYHVTTLVLPVHHERATEIEAAARQLFGLPELVDDVLIWDVRAFADTG